jgi:hypothetical protein
MKRTHLFLEPMRGTGVRRAISLLGVAAVTLILALHSAPPANAVPIVTNGGFETGDFTGWSQFGDTSFTGVGGNLACPGTVTAVVAEGNCAASFGPFDVGGISQVLTLTIGKHYFLSFALDAFGDSPSEFSVSLGGVTLLSLSDPATSGYQTYHFDVIATAALETLMFSFRDVPGFIELDAVSLAPEPGSIALLAIGLVALFLGIRRKVQ